MSILLKKGATVFLSETGHRGFYYPSRMSDTLLFDVDATSLVWVGGGDKKAVLIPIKSIKGSSSGSSVVPVWINKDD